MGIGELVEEVVLEEEKLELVDFDEEELEMKVELDEDELEVVVELDELEIEMEVLLDKEELKVEVELEEVMRVEVLVDDFVEVVEDTDEDENVPCIPDCPAGYLYMLKRSEPPQCSL